ncbi:hypothetical protein D3C79_722100 [compost metagenome]
MLNQFFAGQQRHANQGRRHTGQDASRNRGHHHADDSRHHRNQRPEDFAQAVAGFLGRFSFACLLQVLVGFDLHMLLNLLLQRLEQVAAELFCLLGGLAEQIDGLQAKQQRLG